MYLLLLATLPVFIILFVVYNNDKTKEPKGLLLKLFISGILSCFMVFIISSLLSFLPFMGDDTEKMDYFTLFLHAFIGVALIEEFCKWFMLYFTGYNHKEFDELYDIIVYAVFVSLGFAFFENILYIITQAITTGGVDAIKVALLRGVSAIPGHACDAIFMGYYLSIAKIYYCQNELALEKKNIALSIVVPTILHGIYDFCLMTEKNIFAIIFLVFIIILYDRSYNKLKNMAKVNKKIIFKNKFCPMCGTKVEGEYCGICGTKQE